jgi:hypothetical protein
MSTWVETASRNFVARHEERDDDDVEGILDLLEDTRERVGALFAKLPDEVTVVLHPSAAVLDLAQPALPVARRLTSPTARRYLAGWPSRGTLHMLAPRVLAERAGNVDGSRAMLELTPAALYVQLVVGECNPALPPPWSPRSTVRAARWAWLLAGTAQWFSGQTAYARPAIARRLREGPEPDFPPGVRDAPLLGGTVFDLLAREEGDRACVTLARGPHPDGPVRALEIAFPRALRHTESAWRAHLARL